jgi:hypothetical protein
VALDDFKRSPNKFDLRREQMGVEQRAVEVDKQRTGVAFQRTDAFCHLVQSGTQSLRCESRGKKGKREHMPFTLATFAAGVSSTLLITVLGYGWTLSEALRLVVASIIAGSLSLEVALQIQKLIHKTLVIWAFLVLTFGTTLFLGAPHYLTLVGQSPGSALLLVLPIIACTGASILIFGPIQDRRVAARQRKTWKSHAAAERPLAHSPQPVLD